MEYGALNLIEACIIEAPAEKGTPICFHILAESVCFGWGNISKMARDGAKEFGVEMLHTPSPLFERYRCDPCPLRGVARRNKNA